MNAKLIKAPKLNWRAVGECIATARKRLGLTQAQLATKCGRCQPDISEAERGAAQSVDSIVRVAKALKIKPAELFGKLLEK